MHHDACCTRRVCVVALIVSVAFDQRVTFVNTETHRLWCIWWRATLAPALWHCRLHSNMVDFG